MNLFAIPAFTFVPVKYRELVEENGGKVFGALLICFIILGLITGIRGSAVMSEVTDSVKAECPDFELKNGEFSIDNTYSMDRDNVYMKIDDSIEKVSAADVEALSSTGKYQSVMIIGKNGAGIFNNGQIQTIDFDKLGGFEISKDKLCNTFLPAVNVFIIIGCILGAFILIGLYYLVALIIQFITGVFAKGFFKYELDEKERFRLTVLAKFPPYVVVYILKALSLHVGFFVKIILSLGYIALVLYFFTKADDDVLTGSVDGSIDGM